MSHGHSTWTMATPRNFRAPPRKTRAPHIDVCWVKIDLGLTQETSDMMWSNRDGILCDLDKMFIITHECTMIIGHACTMIIGHACTLIIVLACTMIIVHACTMIIGETSTMITVHARTMIIVNACTMILVHVSCATGLMFGTVQVAGSRGEAARESRGFGGHRGPPMIGGWWGRGRQWILGNDIMSGDGQGWVHIEMAFLVMLTRCLALSSCRLLRFNGGCWQAIKCQVAWWCRGNNSGQN